MLTWLHPCTMPHLLLRSQLRQLLLCGLRVRLRLLKRLPDSLQRSSALPQRLLGLSPLGRRRIGVLHEPSSTATKRSTRTVRRRVSPIL